MGNIITEYAAACVISVPRHVIDSYLGCLFLSFASRVVSSTQKLSALLEQTGQGVGLTYILNTRFRVQHNELLFCCGFSRRLCALRPL